MLLLNDNQKEGLSFDSSLSLSSIDSTVTDQEYKESLVRLLQPILIKAFPNNFVKQKIRVYHDRISCSCPVCGDSVKDHHKKRGNFILKGKFKNFYKCHNCNVFKRIDQFFRDYNVTLDLSLINYIASNLTDFDKYTSTGYNDISFLDTEVIDKYAIDRKEFLNYFKLVEIKESPLWSWLNFRMQYDAQKFMYNPRLNHLIILNLTASGKILGIQKRTFKGPNKYLTYQLNKIYELMHKPTNEIPDYVNSVSTLFNICLISFLKPITLFEGPLDAFLFKNSIANSGANKQLPIDINVRYFYDHDKTGIKKTIEKLNEGNQVFLWDKLIKQIGLPQRSKWDLNDFIIWCKKERINIPNFELFFSNSSFDMIDI